VEFSHGESQTLDAPNSIGTLPGIGEETRRIVGPSGQSETVHTYGWYIRKYVAETRAAGGAPILLTSTVRNEWRGGVLLDDAEEYDKDIALVSSAQKVPLIDIHSLVQHEYQLLGNAEVKKFFPQDRNHTNRWGAVLTASLLLAGWKDLPGFDLGSFASPAGLIIQPYSSRPKALVSRALPGPRDPKLPSVFLAGDSAVRAGLGFGAGGQWGWGDRMEALVDTTRVNVVNRGVAEASSRTYMTRGHWARLVSLIKPGDVVVIQFGHADSVPLEDDPKSPGTLPGTGDDSSEVQASDRSKAEEVHSYGWYLKKMVADVRQAGGIPILCSPTPANKWVDGKIATSADTYSAWTQAVAVSEHVGFIDLNKILGQRDDALGREAADRLFTDPDVNLSWEGAEQGAQALVEGLRQLQPDPIAAYLK
jgi:lysophospholipase L1-like esterase